MLDESSGLKWLGLMFIGIAFSAALCRFAESWQANTAMQQGYEQIQTDSGAILWKPPESQ
jgi:hypothetical protein